MFKCINSINKDNIIFEKGKVYASRYEYPDEVLIYGEIPLIQ